MGKAPLHFLKCNVDAALFQEHRKVGVGIVLRDLIGDFIASTIVWFKDLYKFMKPKLLEFRMLYLGSKREDSTMSS